MNMTEEVQKEIIVLNMSSYNQGGWDSLEALIAAVDHLEKLGLVKLSIHEVRTMIQLAQKTLKKE